MDNADGPDRELTDLVESLQMMKAVVAMEEEQAAEQPEPDEPAPVAEPETPVLAPAAPKAPGVSEAQEYAQQEVEALRKRQAAIHEQVEAKTKEIGQLRETLLVLAGAVQGLEHMRKFMSASSP
jgi:hypothetical protein